MSKEVIVFCRARQTLKEEKDKHREIFEETADAKRVNMDLLKDSMQKNNVQCIALPPDPNGVQQYARLMPTPTRYTTFRTWEDISRLASGFQSRIVQVPEDDVPGEVLRLFLQRATIQGDSQLKLAVKTTVPNKVQPLATPPPEVSRLGKTLNVAIQEYKTCREPIKSLKAASNEAEKNAQITMKDNEPVLLHMDRNGKRRFVNVLKTSQEKHRRSIGIRQIRKIVGESARHAVCDRSNFDVRFIKKLEELTCRELSQNVQIESKLRVQERRTRRPSPDRVILDA